MIKPSRGYILVEPTEAEETSAGGVYLPERIKDMPQKGKVLAVGERNTKGKITVQRPFESEDHWIWDDPPCKVEDTVIFKRFVDQRIKENGEELLFVPFQDILGVVE